MCFERNPVVLKMPGMKIKLALKLTQFPTNSVLNKNGVTAKGKTLLPYNETQAKTESRDGLNCWCISETKKAVLKR